jgi:hypothetical protein
MVRFWTDSLSVVCSMNEYNVSCASSQNLLCWLISFRTNKMTGKFDWSHAMGATFLRIVVYNTCLNRDNKSNGKHALLAFVMCFCHLGVQSSDRSPGESAIIQCRDRQCYVTEAVLTMAHTEHGLLMSYNDNSVSSYFVYN